MKLLQLEIKLFKDFMEREEKQQELRFYVTMAFMVTVLLSILLTMFILKKIQKKTYRRAEIRRRVETLDSSLPSDV